MARIKQKVKRAKKVPEFMLEIIRKDVKKGGIKPN